MPRIEAKIEDRPPIKASDLFPKLAEVAFPIAAKEVVYIGRRVEGINEYCPYWEHPLSQKVAFDAHSKMDVVDTSVFKGEVDLNHSLGVEIT